MQVEIIKAMELLEQEWCVGNDIILKMEESGKGCGSWNSIDTTSLGMFMRRMIKVGRIEKTVIKTQGRDTTAYRLVDMVEESE
jgi:hypothetical protein